ncbi:hypothetical protein [Granulicella arctica]|uniref:Adenylate cyclase n=1 Tax=Granulicella arctica TaxID=940613 RepID=A0A7Y9PGR6_9BACT|nr:hypothetical protein [Granulicella arctica]NYF78876.1 hypothetical protein [Granulicella arctica]
MTDKGLGTSQQSSPELNDRLRLVARVLSSTTFMKSPRLKGFLEFICARTLDGKHAQINEQQIGVHVFGREPSYNPGEDSIVRSQARFLRQRLEEYFKTEGRDEEMHILIPKGSYIPVFEKAHPVPVVAEAPPAESPDTPETPVQSEPAIPGRSPSLLWWLALAVVGCLLMADLWSRHASHHESTSGAAHSLWAALFDSSRPTIVVPSDSTLVILEDLTKTSVHLPEYLDRDSISKMVLPSNLTPLTASGIYSHQYTSVADLGFAVQFARLPEAKTTQTVVRYARDLRMSDLKQANVVLIGGARANPWIELFSSKTPFYVDYDPASDNSVAVRNPTNHEAASYRENPADAEHRAYGVVAFLPGLEGQGQALLVEGTSMAGTESASDFLFDEASFAPFAQQIRKPDGSLPHFEVLLETRSIGGNAPQSRVVSYRILP